MLMAITDRIIREEPGSTSGLLRSVAQAHRHHRVGVIFEDTMTNKELF